MHMAVATDKRLRDTDACDQSWGWSWAKSVLVLLVVLLVGSFATASLAWGRMQPLAVKASAHSCPPFRAVLHSELQGHSWTFDDRMYDITVWGVGCSVTHRLILRADRALSRETEPGVFIAVSRWLCSADRPVFEGGVSRWGSRCKRGRARRLVWGEETLRGRESRAVARSGLRLASSPRGVQTTLLVPVALTHIYFFEFVGALRGPRVRPSRITFAADGNYTVTGLHWVGWGSQFTRAAGVDHVNNCRPNCAQGHVSRVRVHVTLSRLGSFHGREMYRCYRISPPSDKFRLGGCLPSAESAADQR